MLTALCIVGGILVAILAFAGSLGRGNEFSGAVVGVVLFIIGIIILRRGKQEALIERPDTPPAPDMEPPPTPISEKDTPESS